MIVAAVGMVFVIAALLTVFAVSAEATASGDTYTWTGAGLTANWTNPANWTCVGTGCTGTSTPVSDSHSDVVFPPALASGVYTPVLNASGDTDVNTLSIDDPGYHITGSGNLIVDSTSTLTGIVGNSGTQTYTGAVTVSGSGVTIQNSSAVVFDSTVDPTPHNATAALQLFAPATFGGNVGSVEPFSLLSNNKATTVGASAINAETVNFGGNVALSSVSTTISSATGVVSFFGKVDGASGLTVSGASVVFDGDVGDATPLTSVQVNAPLTLGASAVTTTGTQVYDGMSAGTATLDGSSVAFAAAVTEQSTKTLTINAPATFEAGASGFGSLIVNGDLTTGGGGNFVAPPSTGTFDVSGNLDLTAGTFHPNGGTVILDGGTTQQLLSTVAFAGLNIQQNTTLDLNGKNATAAALTGLGTITDNAGIGSTLTADPASGDAFPGAISKAVSLGVGGSSTLTLSGSLSYTGTTMISTGTLDLQTDTSSLTGNITDGSHLVVNPGASTSLSPTISGAGDLTVSSGTTLAITSNPAAFTGNLIDDGGLTFAAPSGSKYTGVISGTGGISLEATSGSLELDGANTFTGATEIGPAPGTTLILGSGGSLAPTDAVQIGDPSDTFDISLASANQTIGDLSGMGTVRLGTRSLTLGTSSSTTFSGSIGPGTGGLTKQGTGTLTLSSTSTYSGPTTVNGGLINFAASADLGSGQITLNGGGLQWASGNVTDISSRLNPLGSNGGTVDTGTNSFTLSTPISGTGGLIKAGSGTLTLSADNTYTGLTDVKAGTLDLSGSIAGAMHVESGAVANVTGTVAGAVAVTSGTLTCQDGTLDGGPVTNSGGTLTGAPDAPTIGSATAGNGKATVSFTPGAATNCLPVHYVVTASPGGATASGTTSPITVNGLTDGVVYTFNVAEVNPVGATDSAAASNQVTPNGAGPTATIISPAPGATFKRGQRVPTHFSCADAPDGPGIYACVDSNGARGGAGLLNTATLGSHTYSVIAVSKDGKRSTATISYTVVVPPNAFTIKPGWPNSRYVNGCGVVKLRLALPWSGIVNVLEKAPLADFKGSHKTGMFTFGKKNATSSAAQTLSLTIKPTAKGRKLIKHHRRTVALTISVSFTPTGGVKHTKVLKGVRVRGGCPAR